MNRITDRCQLADEAVAYLESQGVKKIVPSFSFASIQKTTRLRVHFSTWTEDIAQDGVDGTMTDPKTIEKLGHMASMCAWQLQERWRKGEGKLVQNHFCYTKHRAPLPKNATSMGTHELSFSIHTYIDQRRVPIGSGHSSLAIVHVDSHPPQPHDHAHDTSDSSSEGSDPDYSDWSTDSLEITPSPPVEHQPPEENEEAGEAAILAADSSLALIGSPRTSSLPLEPGSHSKTAMGSLASIAPPPAPSIVPLRSILRELLTPEEKSRKRKRSVSFGRPHDENMTFMLVNVIGARPEKNDTLEKRLREIGVAPKNVKIESVPIKKLHCHVFHFSVSSDVEKSTIENEIAKRKWSQLFDIEHLCSDTSTPFFWQSYPVESIVEATFLAAGKPSLANDFAEQLNDKKYLGGVVKNKKLVKHVTSGLTIKGAKMFHEKIKPTAIF